MAEPTKTLTQLRRDICRELRMPFFGIFDTNSVLTGTPTTTALFDSKLVQADDYWNGDWVFIVDGPAAGDVRRITDFVASTDSILPEYAFSGTPAAGNLYEIHSRWNAYDIRHALNQAIREGWDAFADYSLDETMIVREDVLEYDLTFAARQLLKVWVETPASTSIIRDTASGGAVTYLEDTSLPMVDDQFNGWMISIYKGTGVGQLRTVSDTTAATKRILVSVNWATAPDATSKYALWNPAEQRVEWVRLTAMRPDVPDFPSKVFFPGTLESFLGLRFRFQYEAVLTELTTEASVTAVDANYLMYRAVAFLHGYRAGDNRFDRTAHLQEEQRYIEKAGLYLTNRARRGPSQTLWQESDFRGASYNPDYPF
jgi:hypothetical protein